MNLRLLRNLKPVQMSYKPAGGKTITAIIWVMPDYLAIGSDEDFLRIPLTFPSAAAIVEEFGGVLPTQKMVDAMYEQSAFHLKPQPLPPGLHMRSSEYYLRHQQMIEAQRQRVGCSLGELVSGHKKDIVLTTRLHSKPDRIAIYGWHQPNGIPIQPLSTVHGARYADYSHGVRLVSQTVRIKGASRSILEALQDPVLAPLLTYEGAFSRLREVLRRER